MYNNQDRIFLQLVDETEEVMIVKSILKSPLGLAQDIIKRLFENRFDELNDDLDEIKQFAAGVNRARNLSSNYSLAAYYSYLFSFHQHFNSSYRARQGKVLEAMLQGILKNYCGCDKVAKSPTETKLYFKELFLKKSPQLDADVVGIDSRKSKAIVMQLRSRDDTGGTTAKSSLVELLKEFLRENYKPKMPMLYLLAIWDARDSQQKNSTIEKIYSSLKDYINIHRDDFYKRISAGIELQNNITIQLNYGTKEISNTLFDWTDTNNKKILKSIEAVIHQIEHWDDLWLAYSVASLELDVKFISKFSNIEILNHNYEVAKMDFDFSNYQNLSSSIEKITDKIIRNWNQSSIPLKTPAEQTLYISDLLYLKACYAKLSV